MKKILYIARAGLPIDATGIRTYHIGSLLEKQGYCLHYLSLQRVCTRVEQSGYERIYQSKSAFLPKEDYHYQKDEKIYSYPAPFPGGRIHALNDLADLLFAHVAFGRVKRYCETEKPIAIILYNDAYALTKRLIPYCQKKGIKLFADVTEWYEMDANKKPADKMIAYLTDKRIRTLDQKLDGIIAISRYFEDYYKQKKVRCINIPPLMQVEKDLEIQRHEYYPGKHVVNFIYAGAPGGKDILLPFLNAVQRFNENGIRVRLDLVGLNADYVKKLLNTNVAPEEFGVVSHGRLSHEDTLKIVKKADFGILFRYDKRYAKAGFSTKFAECMSVGVPMICNKIGGCDSFITHMENGLLTNTVSEAELYDLLADVFSLPSDDIVKIKKNAHTFAMKHFDRSTYATSLQTLVNQQESVR
ncbi:MAG: glycosyltransferase [Clostridia bacterium]|nr:glycosyltransferase [Clostridia bacterium]